VTKNGDCQRGGGAGLRGIQTMFKECECILRLQLTAVGSIRDAILYRLSKYI
jgi:hypothetical protein